MKILLFILAISANGMNRQKISNTNIAYYTPGLFNPKFFSFEFSYQTPKKISKYPYHAFVGMFFSEESFTYDANLRAAALGFRGGTILPTQPWVPLYLQFSFGFAKAVLHENPWIGKKEQSRDLSNLLFLEAGVLYRYYKLMFRLLYQINNQDYFIRKSFFSIGVNF